MKKFFYKDSEGKIKRYVYCTKCEKGPFTEDQLGIEYFKMAERISLFYCKSCAIELGLSISEKKGLLNNNNKKDIEDISFEENKKVKVVLMQFYDGSIISFICDNIDTLIKEIESSILNTKLPAEIVYYKEYDNKEAVRIKEKIDTMNLRQKKLFINSYYTKMLAN